VRSIFERRNKLANGIFIGMGMMLIVTGFFGWFSTNYFSGILKPLLEECGIDVNRHYIFNDLNRLIYAYMFFMMIGFVSLFIGIIREGLQKKTLSVTA